MTAYEWRMRDWSSDGALPIFGASTGAWSVPYWWVDGGMAVDQLLLAAVEAGLGACFFGLFDPEPAVLAELGVPDRSEERCVGKAGGSTCSSRWSPSPPKQKSKCIARL